MPQAPRSRPDVAPRCDSAMSPPDVAPDLAPSPQRLPLRVVRATHTYIKAHISSFATYGTRASHSILYLRYYLVRDVRLQWGPQAAGIRDSEEEHKLREFFEERNQLPGIFSANGRISPIQVHIEKGAQEQSCAIKPLEISFIKRNQIPGIFSANGRIYRIRVHRWKQTCTNA